MYSSSSNSAGSNDRELVSTFVDDAAKSFHPVDLENPGINGDSLDSASRRHRQRWCIAVASITGILISAFIVVGVIDVFRIQQMHIDHFKEASLTMELDTANISSSFRVDSAPWFHRLEVNGATCQVVSQGATSRSLELVLDTTAGFPALQPSLFGDTSPPSVPASVSLIVHDDAFLRSILKGSEAWKNAQTDCFINGTIFPFDLGFGISFAKHIDHSGSLSFIEQQTGLSSFQMLADPGMAFWDCTTLLEQCNITIPLGIPNVNALADLHRFTVTFPKTEYEIVVKTPHENSARIQILMPHQTTDLANGGHVTISAKAHCGPMNPACGLLTPLVLVYGGWPTPGEEMIMESQAATPSLISKLIGTIKLSGRRHSSETYSVGRRRLSGMPPFSYDHVDCMSFHTGDGNDLFGECCLYRGDDVGSFKCHGEVEEVTMELATVMDVSHADLFMIAGEFQTYNTTHELDKINALLRVDSSKTTLSLSAQGNFSAGGNFSFVMYGDGDEYEGVNGTGVVELTIDEQRELSASLGGRVNTTTKNFEAYLLEDPGDAVRLMWTSSGFWDDSDDSVIFHAWSNMTVDGEMEYDAEVDFEVHENWTTLTMNEGIENERVLLDVWTEWTGEQGLASSAGSWMMYDGDYVWNTTAEFVVNTTESTLWLHANDRVNGSRMETETSITWSDDQGLENNMTWWLNGEDDEGLVNISLALDVNTSTQYASVHVWEEMHDDIRLSAVGNVSWTTEQGFGMNVSEWLEVEGDHVFDMAGRFTVNTTTNESSLWLLEHLDGNGTLFETGSQLSWGTQEGFESNMTWWLNGEDDEGLVNISLALDVNTSTQYASVHVWEEMHDDIRLSAVGNVSWTTEQGFGMNVSEWLEVEGDHVFDMAGRFTVNTTTNESSLWLLEHLDGNGTLFETGSQLSWGTQEGFESNMTWWLNGEDDEGLVNISLALDVNTSTQYASVHVWEEMHDDIRLSAVGNVSWTTEQGFGMNVSEWLEVEGDHVFDMAGRFTVNTTTNESSLWLLEHLDGNDTLLESAWIVAWVGDDTVWVNSSGWLDYENDTLFVVDTLGWIDKANTNFSMGIHDAKHTSMEWKALINGSWAIHDPLFGLNLSTQVWEWGVEEVSIYGEINAHTDDNSFSILAWENADQDRNRMFVNISTHMNMSDGMAMETWEYVEWDSEPIINVSGFPSIMYVRPL